MITIGALKLGLDYVDIPEHICALYNTKQADSFHGEVSLIRLPLAARAGRGADVIISAGLFSQALGRLYPGVPVVDIRIGTCELSSKVAECRERFAPGRIALIAPAAMLSGLEYLRDEPGAEVRFYNLRDTSDCAALLAQAVRDGCDCVLSGAHACRLAAGMGLDGMLLTPGEHALYAGVMDARRSAMHAVRERNAGEPFSVTDHPALPLTRRSHTTPWRRVVLPFPGSVRPTGTANT